MYKEKKKNLGRMKEYIRPKEVTLFRYHRLFKVSALNYFFSCQAAIGWDKERLSWHGSILEVWSIKGVLTFP